MRIIHNSVAGDPIVIAGSVGIDNISAVPEPATLSMLAAGIFLLAAVRSRLQSKNSRTPRHVAMPSVKGY